MKKIFVISDLHLGGAEGFQMFPSEKHHRLADFVEWVTRQKTESCDVRLILAGDIVDFLAEKEWKAFTANDEEATKKLQVIIDSTKPIWEALSAFVKTGATLTLLLGNHDLELSLHGPRELLTRTIGENIEFIYEEETIREGPLCVEHGNKYDAWNFVDHSYLKELRKEIEHGETQSNFSVPGSRIVVEAMNELKTKFPFVDLLKPETSNALPILFAIDPSAATKLAVLADAGIQAFGGRSPQERGLETSSGVLDGDLDEAAKRTRDALRLLSEFQGGEHGDAGALESMKQAFDEWVFAKALPFFAKNQIATFRTDKESETYLKHARRKTESDETIKVVVFGHTHLAKRVRFENGALYLNTGTWADVMWLPEEFFGKDQQKIRELSAEFLQAIKGNDPIKLSRWRRQVPTFAQITLLDDANFQADIYRFENKEKIEQPLLSSGLLWEGLPQ